MSALLLSPTHRFWLLLSLCLLGFGLLYTVVRDAGRGARRRGLHKRIAALGWPAAGTDEPAIGALREGLAKAQQSMRRAHWAKSASPVPWFLCLGDAAANLPGLFATTHGARADAPSAPSSSDGEWWRWWLTPRLVAVEIDSTAAGDTTDTPRSRGLWLHSLLALAERRDRLPLNGLVVAVAATDLLEAGTAKLKSQAERTRRLLDEASDTLRLQMPTYLVVTGLERLAGYETLHGALPPEVLAQALGHRLTDPSAFIETPAGERLDAVFDPIAQQLHALRMALLREQPGSTGRLAIHEFVEAVRTLRPGLREFAQVLFENHGRNSRAPRWRGFYLTAAASDAVGGAFVHDLFERFLPVDQPLVRPGRPS